MKLLLRNGRILDPSTDTQTTGDLLICDGVIEAVGPDLKAEADRVIDAHRCFIMPGFIDLHVHFREPGATQKETIETGCAAAAHGGYTTVFAMPNTKPVADTSAITTFVENRAREVSKVKVHQVGAITKGQEGKELADLSGMKETGTIALSEDGKSVMNADLYRDAMRFAAANDLTIMAHCEDINMVHGGVMNADAKAQKLGLPGITNAVEDVIVARDILIAKETGARLHLCHCSTADSVKMIAIAKEDGVKVSGEVCPHHFTLCTDDIPGDDPNYKMNPPLRSKEDVEALKQGLKDGTMEVISTDHAPHTEEEKARGFTKAPFGIVGVETAAALTYSELVLGGYLTPMQMMEKMSYNPARILGTWDILIT